MVHKTKDERKKNISAEKYILLLLIVSYFIGVCVSCHFINLNITNDVVHYTINNNIFNSILFFIIALFLKYSGILNVALYALPFFSGVQNSIYYTNIIYNNNISYKVILNILRDTSVLFLLILYIIVILSQIINKKYNIKRDVKYFSVYIIGIMMIFLIEYILKNIIF